MSAFNDISSEVDRFYERTMRPPTFVLVGLREWMGMEQASRVLYSGADVATWYVHGPWGRIEVRHHPTYYSMIAPVLETMP